jgi:DNA-binding response OmpR family regulator
VKAALRRNAMVGSLAPQVYEFGSFSIDFGRCELRNAGERIDITALELKLLRTLITHRGEVLTLDRLCEAVWGKDVFVTNRVIYTHMNNLRRKIEADPQNPRHLITVRGIGYRFDS